MRKCSRCGGSTIEHELIELPSGRYVKDVWKCISCGHIEEDRKIVKEKAGGGENKRMCGDCGGRPTTHPNVPYCGHCLAKRSTAARQKRAAEKAAQKGNPLPPKKPLNEEKDIPAGKPLGESKAPEQRGMNAVSIDFQGFPEILAGVKELAAREIRPIDLQIIYILKCHMRAKNG